MCLCTWVLNTSMDYGCGRTSLLTSSFSLWNIIFRLKSWIYLWPNVVERKLKNAIKSDDREMQNQKFLYLNNACEQMVFRVINKNNIESWISRSMNSMSSKNCIFEWRMIHFFFFFDISAMKEIVTDASTVARLQIVQMIHCCPVHTDLCSI